MSLIHLIDSYGVCNIAIGPVRLEGIPSTNLWIVLEDCPVTWQDGPADYPRQQRFIIPQGMQTDLASVPLRAQSIISPCGPIKEPAVLHDALYQYRPILSTGQRIGRAQADYMLYYACITIGKMAYEEAMTVFASVRIAGSRVWRSHDKDFPA